mmetsp:Transcript_12314/g.51803  ORF Transcript_12314/g.51803 Transcript_12314/m.51803 type:complete len:226 (-) Transcript_12314:177-854(-)
MRQSCPQTRSGSSAQSAAGSSALDPHYRQCFGSSGTSNLGKTPPRRSTRSTASGTWTFCSCTSCSRSTSRGPRRPSSGTGSSAGPRGARPSPPASPRRSRTACDRSLPARRPVARPRSQTDQAAQWSRRRRRPRCRRWSPRCWGSGAPPCSSPCSAARLRRKLRGARRSSPRRRWRPFTTSPGEPRRRRRRRTTSSHWTSSGRGESAWRREWAHAWRRERRGCAR